MRKYLLLLLCVTLNAWALPTEESHTKVELISEVKSLMPGLPFTVGLRMKMDPGWHTYWLNPGDSGLSTAIEWDLPKGFVAGPILWPLPKRLVEVDIMTFAYEKEVLLLIQITSPQKIKTSSVSIKGEVNWLECEEICLPGSAKLKLELPVKNTSPEKQHVKLFETARKNIPTKQHAWVFSFSRGEKKLILEAKPPPQISVLYTNAYFFPLDEGYLNLNAPQVWKKTGNTYQLELALIPEMKVPQNPEGVLELTSTKEKTALQISGKSSSNRFLRYLLFAFIGGMLLNLMPCVFPVISIKILGFAQQAEQQHAKDWQHGLVYALGVIISFWVLAGIIIAMQVAGNFVGWGFQLQSATAVLFLIALFFLLGLSMLGVFELGTSFTGAGDAYSRKSGWVGSFFSGVLATIVATPCTAPFLGPAVGFAFALPPFGIWMFFTTIGLGMAFPYVLLSSSKKLLDALPKPGPWMETIRQGMGFLFMATVIWLMDVYIKLTSGEWILRLLVGLLMMGIGAWVLGRWGAIHRSGRTRWIARIVCVLFIVFGFIFSMGSQHAPSEKIKTTGSWRTYSPEAVEVAQTSGQPVFIDFTAAWCLSCQVNKKTVLHRKAVMDKFAEKKVITFVADWTRRDETIRQVLAGFGRSGVPMYVLYPGSGKEPVLLPEILTTKIMIDALDKL